MLRACQHGRRWRFGQQGDDYEIGVAGLYWGFHRLLRSLLADKHQSDRRRSLGTPSLFLHPRQSALSQADRHVRLVLGGQRPARRFAALLQSPLTDSNRRPLLTLERRRLAVAAGGNGFGLFLGFRQSRVKGRRVCVATSGPGHAYEDAGYASILGAESPEAG
jgi:hypothetical protein